MGKSESAGYIRPFLPARLDTGYPDNYNLRLVRNKTDLKELFIELKSAKKIAIDTETNSVDWGYGHIVGVSCSTTSDSGWYLPYRHENYERNLPLKSLLMMYTLFQGKQILMYNAPFDITMLNKEGWDCWALHIRDVMGLVYLRDTNIHLPSLKDSGLFFLGRKAPTFEETLKGREHFGFIPPEEATPYAATDSMDTFALDELLYPLVMKECPKALKLDNSFIPVLMDLSTTKLPVRSEILPSLEEYYTNQLKVIETKIFEATGFPFNLKSTKQLVEALTKLGISTGYKTDKGAMKVDSEVLALMEHRYPFVRDVISYKSMASTLASLKKFEGKNFIRCNYEMYNTVTGRTSSGSAKEKSKLPEGIEPFFSSFNAQNFLKKKERLYKAIYKPEDPYALLGYRFKPIDKKDIKPEDLIAEAMDYEGNPRRLIHCVKYDNEGQVIADEKDLYWVKCDYAGAELRLATLASGEPILTEAFVEGKDPHSNTAKMMFGVADKAHRSKAKSCNFSLLYEGSADSLSRNSGLPLEEAEELWVKYWETMTTLKRWKITEQQKCAISCTCYTRFNRPRRLAWYFRNPRPSMRSFARRSVISHEIQGTLSDIIKLTLIRSKAEIFDNPKWQADTQLFMTVHDEIDAGVRKARVHEYIDTLLDIGKIQLPSWKFPLVLDPEVGYSYGFMVGVKKNPDTGLYELKLKKGSDFLG